MEHVRSDVAASHCPLSYWDYALEHAADILNRTTSPPSGTASCYEALTGEQPKVMHIQPFGCQARVVKPPHTISKTNIVAKAWTGMHLGCSQLSTNGYNVWLPTANRAWGVATSSDVHFADSVFPWRPAGDRVVGHIPPSPPPNSATNQPPGVPDTVPPCLHHGRATRWPPRSPTPRDTRSLQASHSPSSCYFRARTLDRTASEPFSPRTDSTSPWSTTTPAKGGETNTTYSATPSSTNFSTESDTDTTSPSSPHLRAAHS
eukprot:5643982-Prymnesium_polylepis.1